MDTGSFRVTGLGETMASFLLGLPDLAIHDQTFDGDHYRPPLENVPPVCAGRLARDQGLDVEPGLGLGAGDAHHEVTNRQANFDFATSNS
jgi:hypothetical protein